LPDKTLEKYRLAIAEDFPFMVIERFEYLSEGWDSLACLINEHFIFRFPKRPEVEDSLKVEISLLPELARQLPLPIPNFEFIGQPGPNYPFTFVGYKRLDGETYPGWQGWAAGLDTNINGENPEIKKELQRADWWQADLGRFLTALHAFPVARARELGVKDYFPTGLDAPGQNWQETSEDFYRLVREKVFPLVGEDLQDSIADSFEDFLDNEANFQFEPVLIHADLLDDHVLLDLSRRRVSGVIDFGDVSIGDPALDVWENLRNFYSGALDQTFFERRRFYLKLPPLHAILFGLEHGDQAMIEYGLNGLNF
jgi:aminoglycoside phosphotransferase (APT) family kinase protein